MLGRVFGEEVLVALRDGFAQGDLGGVVPSLFRETASTHLRDAASAAFVAVCETGELDSVALLRELADGAVTGDMAVNPEYERVTNPDYDYDANNEAGDSILTRAARRGRAGVVRALVQDDAEAANGYAANGARALVLAIEAGDVACVDVLLAVDGIDAEAVVSPNHDPEDHDYGAEHEELDTILVRAARAGNVHAVRALMQTGAVDVNRHAPNGELPLVRAILSGNNACVEALLGADGIDINLGGHGGGGRRLDCLTPLRAAASVGNTAWVRRLLGTAGVEVNSADDVSEVTALAEAAQGGHAACVAALLEVDGVDVYAMNRRHETALTIAVERRRGAWEACTQALALAKGIDLNHRNQHSGHTALHEACARKHAALAGHLLIAGGCRFALTSPQRFYRDNGWHDEHGGETALELAAGDKAVAKVFATGVDYWLRRLHGRHGWAMKEAARTLLLVRQRVGAGALAVAGPAPGPPGVLPHLPEEIWLAALGFLRSADFMPSHP